MYAAVQHNFTLRDGVQKAEVHFLIGTKSPKIIRVPVEITQKQVDTLKEKLLKQWKWLTKGICSPNPDNMFCKPGKGGCKYYDSCQVTYEE
jgi:CRISPR/Cas system-associated exonuclease Cas4 (RecB family)